MNTAFKNFPTAYRGNKWHPMLSLTGECIIKNTERKLVM
jgi:hypothetical protein